MNGPRAAGRVAPRLGRMIRRIDLRGQGAPDYRAVVPRADFDVEAALDVVRPICDAVRHRGVEAITEFSARFDGVEQTDIAVPVAALHAALEQLDPAIRAGLEESIRRLRVTCEAELDVPGGIAPLVSSVVMNVVPAQVAGVESIALTSSPQEAFGGLPHPTILAACALLGIDEVYAVGGARPSPCSPTAPDRAARSTWSPAPGTSTRSPPSG